MSIALDISPVIIHIYARAYIFFERVGNIVAWWSLKQGKYIIHEHPRISKNIHMHTMQMNYGTYRDKLLYFLTATSRIWLSQLRPREQLLGYAAPRRRVIITGLCTVWCR